MRGSGWLLKLLGSLLVCSAAFAVRAADPALDQYAVGTGHYALERWNLAVDEFQAFLTKYPQHARAESARFFLGEAQVQLRKFADARQTFRALAEARDARIKRQAAYRVAEASYLLEEWDEAERGLTKFVQDHATDPNNAYALFYLADVALELRRPDQAETRYREALQKFPQGPLVDDGRFGLARALEAQKKREEAAKLYRELASRRAGRFADDAQYQLGVLLHDAGQRAAAAEAWKEFADAFKFSELRDRALLARGSTLYELGEHAAAQETLEPLAVRSEVQTEARYWLGLTQLARQQFAAASETLLAVAAAQPDHALAPSLRFHAGEALRRQGKREAAAEQFQQVVARWPQQAWADEARLGLLAIAQEAADFPALERGATDFLSQPRPPALTARGRRLLARAFLEQKKFAEAKSVGESLLQDAAQLEPGQDRYLLALAQQGLGQSAEALATIEAIPADARQRLAGELLSLRAGAYLGLKRYDEAASTLEAYLVTQPAAEADQAARARLAQALARQGKFKETLAALGAFQQRHGATADMLAATRQAAELATAAEKFDEAAALYEMLAAHGAGDQAAEGLFGRAWTAFRRGQPDEADQLLAKVLEQHAAQPVAAEAAVLRGQIHETRDKPDAALAMYQWVLDKHSKGPQAPRALLRAALLQDRLNRDLQAAELYQRLAEQYPDLPERDKVLYHWAWALHDQGQADQGDALFERLRKEHPQSPFVPDATYRLASRAFRRQDAKYARQLVDDLLSRPLEATYLGHALYLQGQLAIADERWDDVRAALGRLTKELPQHPLAAQADYWLAEADFRGERWDAATARFDALRQAVQGQREPWMAMIDLRRAQLLVRIKKWSECRALAEQLLKEFPEFDQRHEADYLVGRCLSGEGRFDDARVAFRKVVESPRAGKTETAARAQWMIGESHYHQKDYRAAIKEFLRVEILYAYPTWQAAALLEAGKSYELLGDHREAVRLYERLLDQYGQTSFRGETEQRLAAARDKLKEGPAP